MRNAITGLVSVLLVICVGLNAQAQTTPEESTKKMKPHLLFGIYGTLYNTYNRGNLDTWFGEITGDPGRQVDQGSPAFFSVQGAVLFPFKKDELWGGASLEFAIPASHSLWGTQLYFGGRQELVLSPWLLSVGMPIRYRLGTGGRIYATATPALLMGWVSGTYTSSSTNLNFTRSPALGFGLSVDGEVMFSKHFAVNLRVGFRSLKTDLVFEDGSSSTGYSQPLLANGEEVQADLGGTFMSIGASLHY
jgi:hypothetical protein